MPQLPIEIYGPVGAALMAALLAMWRKTETQGAKIETLYRELANDTVVMESISKSLEASNSLSRENTTMLRTISDRLGRLSEVMDASSGGGTQTAV